MQIHYQSTRCLGQSRWGSCASPQPQVMRPWLLLGIRRIRGGSHHGRHGFRGCPEKLLVLREVPQHKHAAGLTKTGRCLGSHGAACPTRAAQTAVPGRVRHRGVRPVPAPAALGCSQQLQCTELPLESIAGGAAQHENMQAADLNSNAAETLSRRFMPGLPALEGSAETLGNVRRGLCLP